MVRRNAIHVARLFSYPSKEIAATYDDGQLHAKRMDVRDFSGDFMDAVYIDAKPLARGQGLAG